MSWKGATGTATGLLDAMPRDPAKHIGPLQQKIIELLNVTEELTQNEQEMLVSIYCHYQERNRISKKQAWTVMNIWRMVNPYP